MMRRVCAAVMAGVAVLAGVVVAPPAASAKVIAAVNLTGPTSGEYGSRITLRGTLWRHGTTVRIAGATVYLQRATHRQSNWTTFVAARTNATGQFAFTVTLGRVYDYRAYYQGSSVYTGALSALKYPTVLQRVRVGSIDDTQGFVVTGSSYPMTPPCPVGTCPHYVYLQRYNPATRSWVSLFSGRRWAESWWWQIGGWVGPGINQLYRIYVPTMYPYAFGYSPAFRFTTYASRPMFAKGIVATGGTITRLSTSSIRFTAGPGGSAWADVNTAGCRSLSLGFESTTPGTTQLTVYAGSTVLGATTDNARTSPYRPPWGALTALPLRGATRIRLHATKFAATTAPLNATTWSASLECNTA